MQARGWPIKISHFGLCGRWWKRKWGLSKYYIFVASRLRAAVELFMFTNQIQRFVMVEYKPSNFCRSRPNRVVSLHVMYIIQAIFSKHQENSCLFISVLLSLSHILLSPLTFWLPLFNLSISLSPSALTKCPTSTPTPLTTCYTRAKR